MLPVVEIGPEECLRLIKNENGDGAKEVIGKFSFLEDVLDRENRLPGFGSAEYPYPLMVSIVEKPIEMWDEFIERLYGVSLKSERIPFLKECPEWFQSLPADVLLEICGKVFPVWCSSDISESNGALRKIARTTQDRIEGTLSVDLAGCLKDGVLSVAAGAFPKKTVISRYSWIGVGKKSGVEYFTYPLITWDAFAGMRITGVTPFVEHVSAPTH